MHRLAIDLGTCNTVAVVARDGAAPRALVFDGSPLLPSAAFLDRAGAVHVGRDAERLMVDDPARFEPFPKRRVDDGAVLLGDREIAVVDLLAAVLRRVVAEAALAGAPAAGGAVLTCPVQWGSGRRAVLRRAAKVAGIGAAHLVDEPVAAAWYCSSVLGRRIHAGRSLAVFDFGGGTLDVTVVRHDHDGPRVTGTGGLDDLGGADVDAALVAHLARAGGPVWGRLTHPRAPADLRDRQLLWTEVRAAKEMLSRATVAPVRVPGSDRSTHLTRDELDAAARPLVDHAVEETARVLYRSGVRPADLDAILLVGGSSRLPLVASRLHARLGVVPVVPEQPEFPVAFGALAAVAATAPVQRAAVPVQRAAAPVAGPAAGAWPAPPSSGSPVSGPPAHGARPDLVAPSVVIGPGVTIEGAVHIRGAGAPPLPGEIDDDDDENDEPADRERPRRVGRAIGRLARTVRTLVLIALPITIVMIVNDPARNRVLDLLDTLIGP
jgi:molecular chaperone DnaK (HSP70)